MRTFNVFNRDRLKHQSRYIAVVGALLVAIVSPVFVSAAQVTQRSIELSSSSVDAANVSYTVNFTAVTSAGAFVVDFCSDTPLVGETCTAPTDFDASSAATSAGGFTIDAATDTNTVVVAGSTSGSVSVELTGITNPSEAGTMYARIVTYDTQANAAAYQSATLGNGVEDQGGVALAITPTVGVSGAVLEAMTFCASGDDGTGNNPIGDGCGGTLTAPTLELGEDTGGVIALSSNSVSTGTIYTQISTNASGGAVVYLKSDADNCGGLLRASDLGACDIGPAGVTDTVDLGEALFGVQVGPEPGTTGTGTLNLESDYSSTAYHLDYQDATDSTGVTGTYGDPIYNTNTDPADSMYMPLTFGASISNNTPAGKYSADLSLIATGTY